MSLCRHRQKVCPILNTQYGCLKPVHRSFWGFRMGVTLRKCLLYSSGVVVYQAECILVRARAVEASGPNVISSSGG